MSRFPVPLHVQQERGGRHWRLLVDFQYLDPNHGVIQAPAGFVTDFASVRPVRTIAIILLLSSLVLGWFIPEAGASLGTAGFYALVLYASVVGYGNSAATIHDHLYHSSQLSRADSDKVFYNALRSSGVARWRAWLMYAGVRIGGHWRYRRQS